MNLDSEKKDNLLRYFNGLVEKRVKARKRHHYYWNDITRYCNFFIHPDYSVLEVGCGTGDLIGSINGRRKVGIDFSEPMIVRAREQFPDTQFITMDADDIRLEERFDVVVVSNLIGYSADVQHLFEELRKVCHDRTRIILTYYNYLWEPVLKFAEFIGLKDKTPNQNWLSQADINNLFYLSGFQVYRESRRLIIPVFIPVLSWLFNKYLARLPLIRFFCLNNFTFACPAPVSEHSGSHSVSIVIPARNESGNIENAIRRIPRFGKSQEIIFVEGNSTDDTWQKMEEVAEKYAGSHQIILARQPGKGKYDAVKKGFEIARGEILMILDADLTVPPEDLPKFYHAIASNKGDFINGCRLVYQMEDQAMRFLNLLGNKFFSMAFTWLLEQSFKDTLCGTKVMFRSDYEKLVTNRAYFGDFDPFGDFDLIFGAHKLNLHIVEIPIRYRERTYGTTNISRFKHGWILLKMCFVAARKIKFI